MNPSVVVVGSLNSDLSVHVARLPTGGETVIGTSVGVRGFGGKGANQAAAAATLGGNVTMVGCVGDDQIGTEMADNLSACGVNIKHVQRGDDTHSGGATICVDPMGENLIIVDPGANYSLTQEAVCIDDVASADVLLTQLETPLPVVRAAIEHASGVVILNPAPFRELDEDLLDQIDILVPNAHELASLAAGPTTTDVKDIARVLRSWPARCSVVVTLGSDGAFVREIGSTAIWHVQAPATAVADTTGAGDCFCGALAVAVGVGNPLVEAVKFAVVAASISTTGVGARGHLPTVAEVKSALAAAPLEVTEL